MVDIHGVGDGSSDGASSNGDDADDDDESDADLGGEEEENDADDPEETGEFNKPKDGEALIGSDEN